MRTDNFKEKPNNELLIGNQIIKTDMALTFGDDRGYFTAINFDANSKRAYLIRNHRAGVIRAFHGHQKENKTLYALKGAFKVIIINMISGEWKAFTITEKGNNMLKIPSPAYNGFVSLTDDAELLITSSSTFEESKADDIRLPYNILGKNIWEIEHR